MISTEVSAKCNTKEFFEALLKAEQENDVDQILKTYGVFVDDPSLWQPLGGFRNNISTVSNQQAEPGGALVEKIINSIDAVLMAECYKKGIDPKSPKAPRSMADAVEQFFEIKHGRLDSIDAGTRGTLAQKLINLVVTGEKSDPCYLIIDAGEGQHPSAFPTTFLGLREDNKINIHFVQGKFHSGGTGVLQFCGTRNYQLIVSRRNPNAPLNGIEGPKDLWGFTIVRRVRPAPNSNERVSRYMYLAPGGNVPSFSAPSIDVLPSSASSKSIPSPYSSSMEYGTCVKLYNFKWRSRGIATLEARYELEKFLHAPCLPFRITETREGYRANYFSTTVAGVWSTIASEKGDKEESKIEPGFPATGELNLPNIGKLPYRIVVFRNIEPKHVPSGICYTLNGQVHGRAPSDFVSRKLEFSYLNGYLLVSLDCEQMDPSVREDWLLASRDRTRKNETDKAILDALIEALKSHPGLREINALRRQKQVEDALKDNKQGLEFLQTLINNDPTLATLLGFGNRLITKTGPSELHLFEGRRFPTFFRLAKEPKSGLVKRCPLNRTVTVEFETDAENEYFTRAECPGAISLSPEDLCEQSHLWDGRFSCRLRAPWNAKVGDRIPVKVVVTDIERETVGTPFSSTLEIEVVEEREVETRPGNPKTPRAPDKPGTTTSPAFAEPNIIEIRRDQWEKQTPKFDSHTAIRVHPDGKGGYDFFLNIDNACLLTELSKTKDEAEKNLVKFWFKWGLVLCSLGMIKQDNERTLDPGDQTEDAEEENKKQNLTEIGYATDGVARVIVPIIRNLFRGPDHFSAEPS